MTPSLLGRGQACDMALASAHDLDSTSANPDSRATPAQARISLGPATTRQAGLNGGWWPRSLDASAELPGLIAEVNSRSGRISRVALQADAFSQIPRLLVVGGRKVHVAWFRYMNTHTVILTMAGGRDDLVLLVIPPQAEPAAAAEALRLASSGGDAGRPDAILAAAGVTVLRA